MAYQISMQKSLAAAAIRAKDSRRLLPICQEMKSNFILTIDRFEQSVAHHIACLPKNCLCCLEALTSRLGPDCLTCLNKLNNTPVHLAALYQDESWMRFAHQLVGSDCFYQTGNNGRNAFHNAALNEVTNSVLKWLVEQCGVDCLSVRDQFGNTPIHLAALKQDEDSLHLFQTILGCDCFSQSNSSNQNAVHFAAMNVRQSSSLKMLVSLLGSSCLLTKDSNDATPVHLAAQYQDVDSLRFIFNSLDCSAFNLVDVSGKTLADYAQENTLHGEQILQLIVEIKETQSEQQSEPIQEMACLQMQKQTEQQQQEEQQQEKQEEQQEQKQDEQQEQKQEEQQEQKQEEQQEQKQEEQQEQKQEEQQEQKQEEQQEQKQEEQQEQEQKQQEQQQEQKQDEQQEQKQEEQQEQKQEEQQEQKQEEQQEQEQKQEEQQEQKQEEQQEQEQKQQEQQQEQKQEEQQEQKQEEQQYEAKEDRSPASNRNSLVRRKLPLDPDFTNWDFLYDDEGNKQQIGEGGFGQVFKVFTDKRQTVAVKIVQLEIVGNLKLLDQAVEQENAEIAVLRSIRHPNILKFLKSQRTRNHKLCIFTELIAGHSLTDLMRRQRKPFDECAIRDFSMQICIALNYLHSRNPVTLHRDIKCSNIMLSNKGIIKLIDFGLAKEIFHSIGSTKSLSGTVNFMAPELFNEEGKTVYSPKSDVWAFGCTIYEMLTMEPPNSELGWQQVGFRIQKNPMPDLPNGVSDSLRDFYRRCVVRNPKSRADTDELLEHMFLPKVDCQR
ncbi:hypothetical protein BOX15_Mlig007464g2 [Macrostomum lignano]|uniref:Protein kinase domain-containing protein n=2 Tax=Macrostomum lignano TaxID=282301 RepID=A0A267G7H0_9PLAT|nr:hypothetical protein BOX15_Mlig007464g1 [Macrostomum lignano]PAA81980.1 hypothetical protein BOX15_Mlig007464g2 [Macrostomum lignano]